MSRSGYSDDDDGDGRIAMWRGQVASAIRGKRGQKFLRDLAAALDAMPEKRLIKQEFECETGVCALGALGKARGIDLTKLDPEDDCDTRKAARMFDIADQLALEVVYENDEGYWGREPETDEQRWVRMRKWVGGLIRETDGS